MRDRRARRWPAAPLPRGSRAGRRRARAACASASNSSTARRATWAECSGLSSQRSASRRTMRRATSRSSWSAPCAAGRAGDRVEQHAFAQRVVAEGPAVDAERLADALEDQRAGEDDVGPRRLDAGDRRAGPRPSAPWPAGRRRRRTSSCVNSKQLNVCGGVVGRAAWRRRCGRPSRPCPRRRWRRRTRSASTSCSNTASAERTYCRHDDTALGCRPSPGKKRSVSRTAPSFMLRAASVSPRWPTSSSVQPPPMSMRNSRWSKTGTACSTPRWMRRASSTPEITSTSTPASVGAGEELVARSPPRGPRSSPRPALGAP